MASLASDIETIFAAWERPDLPGCAVLITKDGDPLYRRGHGMASLEHRVPITPAVAEGDILDLVARQRALNFAPGEDFQYSNTGYTLLALTVRRVSGFSLRA